ncbi:MAG: FkbM family methyltransferase [Planctomycetota bacterium]
MAARDLLKSLGKALGFDIRNRRFSYCCPEEDQQRVVGRDARVVFDVGANRGDTLSAYRGLFPEAEIHAFEPTPVLARHLEDRFAKDHSVHVVAAAVGDASGTMPLHTTNNELLNSLLSLREEQSYYGSHSTETIDVPITPLDDYCGQQGITSIDLLKVDVQGAEKMVFDGASGLLARKAIASVFCELQFSTLYSGQTPPDEVLGTLRRADFDLYGIYDTARTADGFVDFCNALFVSRAARSRMDRKQLF